MMAGIKRLLKDDFFQNPFYQIVIWSKRVTKINFDLISQSQSYGLSKFSTVIQVNWSKLGLHWMEFFKLSEKVSKILLISISQ